MQASEFCYWLQGHFELNGTKPISEEQATIIQNHLNLVFFHDIDPKQQLSEQQSALAQAIHDGHKPSDDIGNIVMRC